MLDVFRLALSFGLSGIIGGLGYWRRSLTLSGWLGAIVVGTAGAGLGGWTWGALIVIFFVTSSALSHWRHAAKEQIAVDKFAKSERRDFVQTMANGGAVVGLALLNSVLPHPFWSAAAVGAIATVTADTWATELGTLSRTPPRLITTGNVVQPGTSGGVTWLGLSATVAGSLLIGVAAFALTLLIDDVRAALLIPAALIGGVVGASSDSVLGATAQAIRWCSRCRTETERSIHRCGTPTTFLRGRRWLNNDAVNFLASLVGAAASLIVWIFVQP